MLLSMSNHYQTRALRRQNGAGCTLTLHRYLAEFDFRYNNRVGLGIDDGERAARIARGAAGKRLTYRPTDGNHKSVAVH